MINPMLKINSVFYDFNLRCRSKRVKRFVKKSQWYTSEKIAKYQLKHLNKVVKFASLNVPFYKKIYGKLDVHRRFIRGINDLNLLPIISKSDLQAHMQDFMPKNWQHYNPSQKKTSGSTGKPLRLFLDSKAASLANALIWRGNNWAGYYYEDKVVEIRMPLGYLAGKINTADLFSFEPHNILKINTALLNTDTLPEIIRGIENFSPAHIMSYPSLLNVILMFLREQNNHLIRPKSVIIGGEKLYPFQRQTVREILGCECFDFYGQWENIAFAFECEKHSLHIAPEIGLIEIIKDGKPCGPGETGEIVATGLRNYSMPLIRYATGDYACIKKDFCTCGRSSACIEIIGSREKDLIVTHKGVFIMMSGIPATLNFSDKIKQIQFYQETIDELVIKIVPNEHFTDTEKKILIDKVTEYLQGSIRVVLQYVEEIPRTQSGKYKYVYSKVPVNTMKFTS